MSVKRELDMSDVESPAAATKKVKRESVLQQLHRQAEQLRTWGNSDGGSLPQAPLIEQSAQASDLLLHFENNQPSKREGTAQGYYNRVTDVSTSITPYWSWSLSTLPAPHEASGYMRVESERGVFSPRGKWNLKPGDCHTRFGAALIADEAKGRQIVGEADDGRLKWNKEFRQSRQLNFNPNKDHDLAKVSDDRVLTSGQGASQGACCCATTRLCWPCRGCLQVVPHLGATTSRSTPPPCALSHSPSSRPQHQSWQSTPILL
jgi:hypothetical protein